MMRTIRFSEVKEQVGMTHRENFFMAIKVFNSNILA
jgi:hypothetical protein